MRNVRRASLGAAIILAAALLALACVQQAFLDRNIDLGRTATALTWNPQDPQALALEADDKAYKSPAHLDQAAALARRALTQSPLQARALRVIAWQDEQLGRSDEARRLMEFAGGLTKRDEPVHWWLYFAAMNRRDYGVAFTEADVLLRQDHEIESRLRPSMLWALEDAGAVRPLVARLAYRPEWRSGLLNDLAGQGAVIANVREVFDRLEESRSPVTQKEAASLVNRLIADGAYQDARAQWRLFLPSPARNASSALIFDPRFQGLPGAPPFNWRLVEEGGVAAEIGRTDDGASGLHLLYRADRGHHLADQLLVLSPGVYHLTAKIAFADPTGEPQVTWKIQCVGADALTLVEARPRADTRAETPVVMDFTVPPTSCSAQNLSLESLPGETLGDREAWVRDLGLVPSSAAAAPAPQADQR